MKTSPFLATLGPLIAALTLAAPAQAFTDANAELREAAETRRSSAAAAAPVVPAATRAVWVPVAPKRLDGFRPVMPAQPALPARALASADAAAAARR